MRQAKIKERIELIEADPKIPSRQLSPGQIKTPSGAIIRPVKVLDKQAYTKILQDIAEEDMKRRHAAKEGKKQEISAM